VLGAVTLPFRPESYVKASKNVATYFCPRHKIHLQPEFELREASDLPGSDYTNHI